MPNPSSEFDAAWARFQGLRSLILGPETLESAWAHGRDRYAALLIPVDDPATVTHIHGIVDRIAGIPSVEPYPEPYWHITIKGIGFLCDAASGPDEVPEAQMASVSDQIGEVLATRPPFTVQAGRVNGFPEVVFIEVWDAGAVRELNTTLLESVPGIIRQPFDGRVFLPHISIARFASHEGLPQLKTVLAELRESPPGPAFTARRADLICAHLSAGPPTLERLRRFEFSG